MRAMKMCFMGILFDESGEVSCAGAGGVGLLPLLSVPVSGVGGRSTASTAVPVASHTRS